MNDINPDGIKKIAPEQVEVVGATQNSQQAQNPFGAFQNGGMQMKVIQGGPLGLLLIPILIPFLLIGFFLLIIAMFFFGTRVFKMVNLKRAFK